jgi:hypothetical protein
MIRSAILLAILAISPAIATAGGDSWKVKVVRMTPSSDGQTTLVFEPLEAERAPWAGCRTVSILIAFRPESFGKRTWSREQASEATHRQALAKLATAAKTGAPVRFGSMGSGLLRLSDSCTFESRGLALVEEYDGREQVYSFHGPI